MDILQKLGSIEELQTYNYNLPEEIMIKIFRYINNKSDISSCNMTCKYWHVISIPQLWKNITFYSINEIQIYQELINDTQIIIPYQSKPSNLQNLYRKQTITRNIDFSELKELERMDTVLGTLLTKLSVVIGIQLETLNLSFCKGVKNFELHKMLPYLTNLRKLNLKCGGLTDIILKKIAKHCRKLEKLFLAWNMMITNFGIVELILANTGLIYLDLKSCSKITGIAIKAISKYCKDIVYLDISFCSMINELSLKYIFNNYKLQTLLCFGSNFSVDFLYSLEINYPKCNINLTKIAKIENI